MSSIISNPSNVVTAGDINFTTSGGNIYFTTAAGTLVTINSSGVPAMTLTGNLNITGSYMINGVAIEQAIFATNEVPVGAIDGLNLTFSLAHNPTAGSEEIYVNGVHQNPGPTNDYVMGLGGPNVITFNIAPPAGSVVLCSYRY